MDKRELSMVIYQQILKIEGVRHFKRFNSNSQWSKTSKIQPKKGRISTILDQIHIKLLRISSYRLERASLCGLIKKDRKLKELDFLHFYSISQWSKTVKIWPKNGRISTVLGQTHIKSPQINSVGFAPNALISSQE